MFKKINKKGFTLAELLIVVAIIGVLVAISIPIFTQQLEKAKLATNQANARAAYAATVAGLLDKKVMFGKGEYEVKTAKCTITTPGSKVSTYAASGTYSIAPQDFTKSKFGSETFDKWTVSIGSDGTVKYSAS